jgi:hypothetical protein
VISTRVFQAKNKKHRQQKQAKQANEQQAKQQKQNKNFSCMNVDFHLISWIPLLFPNFHIEFPRWFIDFHTSFPSKAAQTTSRTKKAKNSKQNKQKQKQQAEQTEQHKQNKQKQKQAEQTKKKQQAKQHECWFALDFTLISWDPLSNPLLFPNFHRQQKKANEQQAKQKQNKNLLHECQLVF